MYESWEQEGARCAEDRAKLVGQRCECCGFPSRRDAVVVTECYLAVTDWVAEKDWMTRQWILLEMKCPRNLGVSKIHSQTDKNRLYRLYMFLFFWDLGDSSSPQMGWLWQCLLWLCEQRLPFVPSFWREAWAQPGESVTCSSTGDCFSRSHCIFNRVDSEMW